MSPLNARASEWSFLGRSFVQFASEWSALRRPLSANRSRTAPSEPAAQRNSLANSAFAGSGAFWRVLGDWTGVLSLDLVRVSR